MDRPSFVATMFMSYAAMAGDCVLEWDATVGAPGATAAVVGFSTTNLGTGERLLALGSFTSIGGIGAPHAAVWDGASWSATDASPNSQVSCAATTNDGLGDVLWFGGSFTQVNSSPALNSAQRSGGVWTVAGSGFNQPVRALESVGGTLYAGGEFWLSGTTSTRGIAQWNGAAWAPVGGGLVGQVRTLTAGPTGSLIAGGSFEFALGGPQVNHIARWMGSAWSAVSGGFNGEVRSVITGDLGDGTALYAAGAFSASGATAIPNVGVNRGAAWEALGSGPGGPVNDLLIADLGNGPVLLAAGRFGPAEGGALAMWDGASWSIVAGGLTSTTGTAEALALGFDPASGAIAVGGRFDHAGGVPSTNIALLTACKGGDPADLSDDGSVNASDLAMLLAAWGPCASCPADLNNDGTVNASDLAVLLAAWG